MGNRILIVMVVAVVGLASCSELDTGPTLSKAERRVKRAARKARRELRQARREAQKQERQARKEERRERRERRQERREDRRKAAAAVQEEEAANCTPGYSPCLAPASDYDCAGGTGDGPEYTQGPIQVTGSDPYDLDSDGDGVACET